MSLVDEPAQENDRKEPEIRLQEDIKSNEFDPEDEKDKNMMMKDVVKTSQRDKSSINPLSLFSEDFSQFKEDVLKVFRDKDTKTEDEDRPSTQAENKSTSSALGLLKEDFSHFKDDVTSVFTSSSSKDKETKSADHKASQPAEKTISRLSLLKEDFNHFKEDLSNVFRIGLSKERDNKAVTAKEETSDTMKIKGLKAERADEPFNPLSLFRRDGPLSQTSQTTENNQGGKKTFSENGEGQVDDVFRGNLSEQDDETVDVEKINNNNMKDNSELTETQHSEEMSPTSQAEDQRIQEEEEEKPSESLPLESSGISNLTDPNKDDTRYRSGGDLWSVKNFACYLTFDPNTANSELHLTDCNRRATRVWSERRPAGHSERFERCPQVLCREALLDSVYWEVVWSGGADVGITYNSISRDGDTASCLLGHNKRSWSLECSEGSYTPCHDKKRFRSSSPRPFTHRVGVYLDWYAGSLSFYCVSRDTMVHLHTFTSTFTEPLYPGFWVWAYDGSVSLCQVELDWERLLE
ncbi:uncharacterized protein LOC119889421 isoform X2 [Micropterus salmoides]|uniref:uncharacterized protein LOC119889421 isoform X2 n=1 Tax=Micropterus salmoides TaxID=27706 RepID=UPI0018ED69A0|nr:uncharacterized protein LOC119889421 isoform X2 [Micropterus salmoides]